MPDKFPKETVSPVVTKRRMADIMTQRNGFRQILVEPEQPGDGSGNFGDKLNMQNAMGDVIVFDEVKHLGFVNVSGIGQGMQNPVRIQGKTLSVTAQDAFFTLSPNSINT